MLGAISTGRQMSRYLEFPPHTRYVQHTHFSWSAFALISAFGDQSPKTETLGAAVIALVAAVMLIAERLLH